MKVITLGSPKLPTTSNLYLKDYQILAADKDIQDMLEQLLYLKQREALTSPTNILTAFGCYFYLLKST